MLETLKNAWRIEDLRKKILYTLFMLLIFRLGSYVPVAGVDVAYIAEQTKNYDILGLIDMLTGGSFSNFTIFAMGISPYITASIIMQLLTFAIPKLEQLNQEGEEGRKKIARISRYVAIGMAFIQATGIIIGMGSGALVKSDAIPVWLTYITIGLTLTAGTAIVMWIGERITEKGIGNGTSLLIFTSIVCKLPTRVYALILNTIEGNVSFWALPVVIIGALLVICGITYIDLGERRIPVQYAKRVVGRKMYGGQSTHIPMKVNSTGVMPLIFAVSMVTFPQVILQFWPNSDIAIWWNRYLGTGTVVYIIAYALLILGFSYFYSMISFNPIEVSKNIQQYGGFIPGIRPGRPTSEYLQRISNKLVLFSAIFLAIIAAVPEAFRSLTGMRSAFGATSILILVSVALETSKALESQMMMRHYKGFLNG